MKKFLSILAAAFLIAALLPMSAAAHGHGSNHSGNGSTLQLGYVQCSVENCSKETVHRHGKTWYGGHSADDGHSHHTVCTVSGCTKTGVHEHNGVSCFPKGTSADDTTNSHHRSIGRHH